MILLNTVADLARAVGAGRLSPRDQVYVPSTLPAAAGEADWSLVEEALRRAGASVHALPGLAHIYILTFDELKAGAFPPFLPPTGPSVQPS